MSDAKCPMARNEPSNVVPIAPIAKRPTGIEIAGPLERRNAKGLEIEGLTSAVEMAAHVTVKARGTAAPSKVALRARNNDDARA